MIDQRTLAFISGESTRTGLQNIGAQYAQGVQMGQSRELMRMKQDAAEMDRLGIASGAMGAYSKAVQDAVDADPTLKEPDSEKMAVLQNQIRSSFPEALQQYIPETTQSMEEINRGYENSLAMQKILNPDKQFKPDYNVGVIKNKKTEEISYGRTINGKAQVQLKGGGFRNIDPKSEIFIRGDATVSKDQLAGLTDDKPDLKMFPEDQKVLEASDEMATASRTAMPRINLSIDLYRAGLIEGGALTEFMADFRNLGKTLTGFDMPGGDDINAVYTATATVKNATLTKTKELKGAISERELAVSEQATGLAVDNPGEASLLNLKITKMAHLREDEYNRELRAYIAIQREKNKKPTIDNFAAQFEAKIKKRPGVISKTETVGGRETLQFLFHWEQREKEIQAARRELMTKGVPSGQQERIIEKIGQKFDEAWMNKHGR